MVAQSHSFFMVKPHSRLPFGSVVAEWALRVFPQLARFYMGYMSLTHEVSEDDDTALLHAVTHEISTEQLEVVRREF